MEEPEKLVEAIVEREVYRADELEVFAFEQAMLEDIAKTLDRVNKWELAVTGGNDLPDGRQSFVRDVGAQARDRVTLRDAEAAERRP